MWNSTIKIRQNSFLFCLTLSTKSLCISLSLIALFFLENECLYDTLCFKIPIFSRRIVEITTERAVNVETIIIYPRKNSCFLFAKFLYSPKDLIFYANWSGNQSFWNYVVSIDFNLYICNTFVWIDFMVLVLFSFFFQSSTHCK